MTALPLMPGRPSWRCMGTGGTARLSILIYHRVHATADSLLSDQPDAVRFAMLMRFVARAFRVMTLGEAATHLARGSLPRRSLVITFDDGYADNAEVALPILRRYGLRATFFVASGFLDGGRMWNDSVIESVRLCRHPAIDLSDFGLASFPLATIANRRQAIDALLPRIKYYAPEERASAVAHLQQLCAVPTLPEHLMMRPVQVQQLHASGMEIGGHTVSHPILTSLSSSLADAEISDGRKQLQSIVDAPVDVFAYPNGKPGIDFDGSHVDLVKRNGFRAAVTTAPGVGRSGDDPYQLPRFTPWGRTLAVWAARLVLNQRNTRYDVVPEVSPADSV